MMRRRFYSANQPITVTQQRDIERMARQLGEILTWEEQFEYEDGAEDHVTLKAERQHWVRQMRAPMYKLTRHEAWAWK